MKKKNKIKEVFMYRYKSFEKDFLVLTVFELCLME